MVSIYTGRMLLRRQLAYTAGASAYMLVNLLPTFYFSFFLYNRLLGYILCYALLFSTAFSGNASQITAGLLALTVTSAGKAPSLSLTTSVSYGLLRNLLKCAGCRPNHVTSRLKMRRPSAIEDVLLSRPSQAVMSKASTAPAPSNQSRIRETESPDRSFLLAYTRAACCGT